jgi:hypothetical protein
VVARSGYDESLAATGFHSLDGATFFRQLRGAPRDLVSLVAYHSGAVFEAERRGLADELAAIDPPPQPVLDALTFVDVTT